MPPRTVKRGAATKRGGRSGRVAVSKVQNQPPEESPKMEEEEEERSIVNAEEKAAEGGAKSDANVSASLGKEEGVKYHVDEYAKDERLDLDDNEPEYEHEEYGGEYEYKEIEQDDIEDMEYEVEEEPEEDNIGEEEEGDLVEDELEEVEEFEGEENEGHGGEVAEHAQMVDAEEEVEHHEVFNERRKRKEFEVFVGGLDKDATEDDLRKVFSRVGKVTEVRLMMNPQTRKNKGFAFLRFATVEQAKRAVTELKSPVINGKQCGVSPSQDSDTLFLGNICKTWTKEALKKKLKHYGVENVEDLTLVEDGNNEGMNRGFAFLEFSSRLDAMDAFKRLQKRDILFGVDRPAKVSFADSFIDPGDEIMAQVKTVFVDGLPASWDEDHVRELLKKYGKIEKVELARNMPSAKRKDFGFVTFDTHEAAVTCAKSINNAEMGEENSKAKVRARLSRPLQRGKGKHSSRGEYWSGHMSGRVARGPWVRSLPHSYPSRVARGTRTRVPPANIKRPVGLRDRHHVVSVPARGRLLVPPSRSFGRRAPPVPSYPKSSLKREYVQRDELPPPRSRPVVDYGSRAMPERRPSYRDDYSSRSSGYPEMPRGTSRTAARRAYIGDGFGQRFERPTSSYREERARDCDSISGSKRPYIAMDDFPPQYADRHSRARLDYELGSGSSQYADAYGDRLGRSNPGYGGGRSSSSTQDSHGPYSSRQGMGYGGSYGGSDIGEMYPSRYGGDYLSRGGSDMGGSSYSAVYSSRGMSDNSYGSGSYY